MKIKAIAPWFGGKRNLAPQIVEELGRHRVYWEPFAGSMAVLMSKPSCVMETVNDLHGDLINLARVIQDRKLAPQFYRRLRRIWMVEALFEEAAERIWQPVKTTDPNIDRAIDYMLVSWMGRNGTAGTLSYNHHFCTRYTANGGHAAKRWTSVIRSIPAWHQRMRNVTILSRDAFELLPRIDDKSETAIYVDPPYIAEGTKYVHKFTPRQHLELAEQLRRFKHSRVVVSYYEHPIANELYSGWTKRCFAVNKAMANQRSRGTCNSRATEVLYVNGPSSATQGKLF